MTPEEKFNQQVWEILQGIQEEILATVKGKPIKYRIPNVVGVGIIPPDRRRKILYKLEEEKAFKIQRNAKGTRIGTGDIFYLIIDSLKFDEAYKKYQSKQKTGQIQSADFTPRSTLPVNPSAIEIFKNFSPQNYSFVLTVLEKITSLAEFSSDETAYYQLQYPYGQLIIQERMLLAKFETLGLFRNAGEDGIHGIATLKSIDTKTIKQVITEINKRKANLQNKPEKKNDSAVPFRNNTQKYRKLTPTKEEEFIKCCGLTYSLQTNKLSYGGKNETDKSSETREMKFFLTLYEKKGKTVDYKDIAKSVDTQDYKYLSGNGKVPQKELLNKNFSEDISLLRRDFRKLVLSLGMTKGEFSKMIKTIQKKGYQLVCQ